MNNHANNLDKLMDIYLKWVLKEVVIEVFLNFLAWMSGSNNAFFKLSLDPHCNNDLLQCGGSCMSGGSPPLLEQQMYIFLCV